MDKILHYCWFGRGELPPLVRECMKSWRTHCPDYELVRWDEDSFDVSSHPYVAQAYAARRYAFVTDYVRLWALVRSGGVYLDTDVELLKPIDRFLEHAAFSGFERPDVVPTAIMGAAAGHPAMVDLLAYYDGRPFLGADGEPDLTPNVEPITDYYVGHGLVLDNSLQTVRDTTFYPKQVFCPKDYGTGKITLSPESVSIHHFAGSWLTPKGRASMHLYRLLARYVPGFQESREGPGRKGRAAAGDS